MQRSLPSLCQHWLTPAIERTLENCAPPVGLLRIERLELDAGNIKLERLEHDLVKGVAEALEKSLRELIPSGEPSPTIVSGNVHYESVQHSIIEAFIHFLATGTLPWSFHLPDGMTLEQVILGSWQEATHAGISPYASNDALLGVLASGTVRKRLIRQFSSVFQEALLSLLSPQGKKAMNEVLQLLHGSDETPAATKQFEQRLWETAFAKIAAKEVFTSMELVGETWSGLHPAAVETVLSADVLERFRSIMSNNASSATDRIKGAEDVPPGHAKPGQPSSIGVVSPNHAEVAGSIRVEPETQSRTAPALFNQTEQRPQSHVETRPPSRIEPGQKSHSEQRPPNPVEHEPQSHTQPGSPSFVEPGTQSHAVHHKARLSTSRHPDTGVGIYIENAGLVLLHPFLPRLFGALGISADDKLLQPERALCLLHFLTTGRLIAPEYDLVLPKILCNVPLETPVDSDVILTVAEQEEAVALLQAAIRHWEALRNTSPDGLRGTFLLRSGKVSLRDDGNWLLQVESKSCDILLDSLPWGISMTRLPWMESMLWVEWR